MLYEPRGVDKFVRVGGGQCFSVALCLGVVKFTKATVCVF